MPAEPTPDHSGINPAFLLESLRSFGYTPPTAIADLVDNSITAGATSIQVQFTWQGTPTKSVVTVSDNGSGMTRSQLATAMIVPSSNARDPRDSKDLGRFGLGMKTASWSIGKRMTVSTQRGGRKSVLCWDLDRVADTGAAAPFEPDSDRRSPEAAWQPPGGSRSGTRVTVEHCDQLLGHSENKAAVNKRAFEEVIENTRVHLQMVFHRFLGRPRKPIAITVNDYPCDAWDPFLKDHDKTQLIAEDPLLCAGEMISVRPYILPHRSFLSDEEALHFEGSLGAMQHQGFFVYRADRLIVPGGWFGRNAPGPRGNTVLARIEVDLSQHMDDHWNLNVLKSQARPPASLRSDFGRIGDTVRKKSIKVYNYRGWKAVGEASPSGGPVTPVWLQEKTEQPGPGHPRYRFRINPDQPIVQAAVENLGPADARRVRSMIRTIESTLPVAAITAADMAEANSVGPQHAADDEHHDAARQIYRYLCDAGLSHDEAIDTLQRTDPFNELPGIVESVREETRET